MDVSGIVVVTIAAAMLFAIINGFHDAANSIATVVSTRVLSPRIAVMWAAFFNFVALFVFHQGVADTIAKTVEINGTDPAFVWVVLCGLSGAILWNLLTWFWGLPSSSSHALIGGLSGAGIAYGGTEVINWQAIQKTVAFIVLAPLLGFLIGSVLMFSVYWSFRRVRPRKVDRAFRIGQLISAAAYSVGHGGNDAQTTIGVIWTVMIAGGMLDASATSAPYWVLLAAYSAMALGTAIGGWRIVKTMGMGLTHLKPVGGFCAEVAGAITLFMATFLKIPVSTTHTITSAIVGVGSVAKARGIRWSIATRIIYAWIFTIPAAALVGAGTLWLARALDAW
ncbi:MAG: inorganic phosphate transporter [Deltaproteobacteria bacterium]|nr:inorganic phosphate transporter [Deltaproteobacteria bacterium]MDQ3299367.1 inorganic phosphate transporter [Myxococcota bacterium]